MELCARIGPQIINARMLRKSQLQQPVRKEKRRQHEESHTPNRADPLNSPELRRLLRERMKYQDDQTRDTAQSIDFRFAWHFATTLTANRESKRPRASARQRASSLRLLQGILGFNRQKFAVLGDPLEKDLRHDSSWPHGHASRHAGPRTSSSAITGAAVGDGDRTRKRCERSKSRSLPTQSSHVFRLCWRLPRCSNFKFGCFADEDIGESSGSGTRRE